MSRRGAESAAGGSSPSRRRLSARDVVIAGPMRATMGPRAAAGPIVVTICKWANSIPGCNFSGRASLAITVCT